MREQCRCGAVDCGNCYPEIKRRNDAYWKSSHMSAADQLDYADYVREGIRDREFDMEMERRADDRH